MPKKFFSKYLPDPDEILSKPWCAPFRPWLRHRDLWRLNRRSVPAAVAIGLFCGLIPGPFQMLGALIACLVVKKNVPVALAVTFYTNPFTIVPLYVLAYAYGRIILGSNASGGALPYEGGWSLHHFWEWTLSLGKPLGIGILALALTLAVLGYFVTELAWRAHVVRAWRARRIRRSSPP